MRKKTRQYLNLIGAAFAAYLIASALALAAWNLDYIGFSATRQLLQSGPQLCVVVAIAGTVLFIPTNNNRL